MDSTVERALDWTPCFADPTRGVAFFDGITIESDSITDPRRDRVLPILKEEQIFMCRQMRHLLKPGALVLDVGTGSGVFAIWAATHGCRVVAVDISERAIRVARQNAKTNAQTHDVRLTELGDCLSREGIDHLEAGDLCLKNLSFDIDFAREFSGVFDLVFLSPPYNPTCERIIPAQHASAGIIGQVCFEDQIELVPQVLKEGGTCIGNQMTPSDGDSSIYAIRKTQESFAKQDQDCTIRYAHILKETFDVEDFLKGMYGSFVNGFAQEFPTYPDPEYMEETYFKKAKKDAEKKAKCDNPRYALIYYEVENKAKEPAVGLLNERHQVPDVTWQDRIQLHRDIVEHTSDPGLIPSHSLFMQRGPVSDFPLAGDKDEQEQSKWKRSPLYIADRWVSRRGLLGTGASESDDSTPFDVMMVDTAPMHREVMSPLQLLQECKAWLPKEKNETEDEKAVRKNLLGKLLEEWQRNTLAQQEESVGPFLHPHFIKAYDPNKWSDIQCTTLASEKFEERRAPPAERLRSLIRGKVREARNRQGEVGDALEYVTIEEDKGYSYSELSVLRVPNTNRNNADYISKMRALIEEANFPQSKSEKEKAKTHLELCHEVMHERVHRIAQEALGQELAWSALIGIPLSLAYAAGDTSKSKVPDTYRGGVWLFAGVHSREWTLEHEETLFDFSRLLWMLYNGKYNVEATKSSSEVAKYQAATVSGHEAGPQMTLVETALPMEGETMTERAYKLIRGSLRYARLFLNETADNVPDSWLPWDEHKGEGQRLDEWIRRTLTTGWEIAVSREARGIEFREIDQNEDVWDRLMNFDIEKHAQLRSSLNYRRFRPPEDDNEANAKGYNITPWNMLRWLLAASSNAYKWCAPPPAGNDESSQLKKLDLLERWSENIDSFCQVNVSLERADESSKQNTVFLSVSNGCKRPVPEDYKKPDGTLGALESIARNMGCNFRAHPLNGQELEERLPGEEYGFTVSIELPAFIFEN